MSEFLIQYCNMIPVKTMLIILNILYSFVKYGPVKGRGPGYDFKGADKKIPRGELRSFLRGIEAGSAGTGSRHLSVPDQEQDGENGAETREEKQDDFQNGTVPRAVLAYVKSADDSQNGDNDRKARQRFHIRSSRQDPFSEYLRRRFPRYSRIRKVLGNPGGGAAGTDFSRARKKRLSALSDPASGRRFRFSRANYFPMSRR